MWRFTAYRRNISQRDTHNALQKNADGDPQFEGVIWTDGTVPWKRILAWAILLSLIAAVLLAFWQAGGWTAFLGLGIVVAIVGALVWAILTLWP